MKQLTERVSVERYKQLTGQRGKSAVKAPKQPSKLEELFAQQAQLAGLLMPEREYRFSDRRYRFDFCWPAHKLALEIQGGYYSNGRHNRDPIADSKKANYAGLQGWQVVFAKPDEIKNGKTLEAVREMLAKPRGAAPEEDV